jgi:hypothetical protein
MSNYKKSDNARQMGLVQYIAMDEIEDAQECGSAFNDHSQYAYLTAPIREAMRDEKREKRGTQERLGPTHSGSSSTKRLQTSTAARNETKGQSARPGLQAQPNSTAPSSLCHSQPG